MPDGFEDVADSLSALNESALKRATVVAGNIAKVNRTIEILEQQLKAAKEELRKMEEQDLPAILAEAGVSQFTMEDGTEVVLAPFYSVSYLKGREDEVMDWLRDNGHGDIVKNVVSVQFGRQENDQALELLNSLLKRGYATSNKQWIEPMTWKAFSREQIEKGTDFPDTLFSVYVGNKAKLVAKKGRK